jgi:hypothetical protein
MDFSGFQWQVKDYRTRPHGPGYNYFDPDNVWLDNGLHLRIHKRKCAEVYTRETFGYGTYRFYINSRFDEFPIGVTLGLFTYARKDKNKEIDIELRKRKGNGVFVVQKSHTREYFGTKLKGSYTMHQFCWTPEWVAFKGFHGHDAGHLIHAWVWYHCIPISGDEKVHINLWLKKGMQAEAHAVIKKFEFIPL